MHTFRPEQPSETAARPSHKAVSQHSTQPGTNAWPSPEISLHCIAQSASCLPVLNATARQNNFILVPQDYCTKSLQSLNRSKIHTSAPKSLQYELGSLKERGGEGNHTIKWNYMRSITNVSLQPSWQGNQFCNKQAKKHWEQHHHAKCRRLTCLPYLWGHDGSGQWSWGHHPTRISTVLCAQVSGLAATHSGCRPSSNDCSCLEWGLLPSPERELGQTLGLATHIVSI